MVPGPQKGCPDIARGVFIRLNLPTGPGPERPPGTSKDRSRLQELNRAWECGRWSGRLWKGHISSAPFNMAPLCASLPLGPAASEEVREPPRELCFQSQEGHGTKRGYQPVGERDPPWATQGSLSWSLEKQLGPGAFITEEIA